MVYLRAQALALAIATWAGPYDGEYIDPSFVILAPIFLIFGLVFIPIKSRPEVLCYVEYISH